MMCSFMCSHKPHKITVVLVGTLLIHLSFSGHPEMQRTYGLFSKEALSLLVIRRLLLSNLFCLLLLSISSKSAGAIYVHLFGFGVRRTHTIHVTSFWMMCNFRVWVQSWTG